MNPDVSKSILPVIFACLLPSLAPAQDRRIENNLHGWYRYTGDQPIAGTKWGIHLEGQYRRSDLITKWQQLLLHPGVNYQLTPKISLTAGYAFSRTYPYSDYAPHGPATNEHRLLEQVWFRYGSKPLAWSTRIRFENRFLGVPDGGHRYENRLRFYQQATRRLTPRHYLTANDEFRIFIKPYVAHSAFDQNRAYGALGIYLKPGWRFELGYMNQAALQRSGRVLELNHTMVMAIYSTAPLFRRR